MMTLPTTARSETTRCAICGLRVDILRDATGRLWKESPRGDQHECAVLAEELTYLGPPHACLCGGLVQSDVWGHRLGWLDGDATEHDACRLPATEWAAVDVAQAPMVPDAVPALAPILATAAVPVLAGQPTKESDNGFRVVPW